MGFPGGAPDGAPFRGEVRGTDARGWHHVEADKAFGRTLEPGFSGGPAIGVDGRLLGIVDIVNPDERRGVLIPVEALMRAWPPLAEPYRGLDAFREEDAAYFFGRESVKKRLWQSFERNPVTLLIGPSGSGKSSLINAGFLPSIRHQGGWRIIRMQPREQPLEELARGVVSALDPGIRALKLREEVGKCSKTLLENPAQLLSYSAALQESEGYRICLIVDQLEETFTLARRVDAEQHQAFLLAIAAVGRQQGPPPIRAILGIRSDFQTLLQTDDAATELIKAVDGEPTIMLRRLDPSERERVIQGPLDRLGVHLENGLLGDLIDEMANNPDALPLLEFALTALWVQLRVDGNGRWLTRAVYQDIGGLSGAVANYADQAVDDLSFDPGQVKRLFLELVHVRDSTEQDARRPRSRDHLDRLDPNLWPLAQRLADKRLLITTGEPGVDIVHEALFRKWRRLADWIDEERDFLRWRQQIEERARDWVNSGCHPTQLLQGPALGDAVTWLDGHREALVASEIVEFIHKSRAEAAAECIRLECGELWDRVELNWEYGNEPPHEIQSLFALARASKEVRLHFLTSAIENEPRARRFNRVPGVILRAALGLDTARAEALASWLMSKLSLLDAIAGEQRRAAVNMGSVVISFAADLAAPVAHLSVSAIAATTDPDQLQAYGRAVTAMQAHIRREAWIFVAIEVLKHPLAGYENIGAGLVAALGGGEDFWGFVQQLEQAEPWLPLARPWQPDAIAFEFRHLLDRGPPLPERT